jgi:hypothetical protein
MARTFRARLILIAAALCCAAPPAFGQLGAIFGDAPPRPPADVPGGRDSRDVLPPTFDPLGRQPFYEPRYYPRSVRPAPMPLEAAPAQASAPSGSPGRGGIQSQPLPPPPGSSAAPIEAGPPPQSPNNAALAPKPGSITPTAPPSGTTGPGAAAPTEAALPPEETVVEPPAQRIANPTAVFAGLDKITGRITSFDVAIGETVQFGALQVTPRVCYSRPPTETARTDAFLQVDEVTLQGEVRRIFTGWMFAASPGLHAIEHPIYDIWLTDCKGGSLNVAGAEDKTGATAQASPPKPAPQKPPPRRR